MHVIQTWQQKEWSRKVPPAKRGSWEEQLHRISAANKLISKDIQSIPGLSQSIGHRAIGVQYNPGNERGNYVPSVMPSRYDAFLYIDKTTALRPLPIRIKNEPPDTYPSGY